jgi:hypothetical protein
MEAFRAGGIVTEVILPGEFHADLFEVWKHRVDLGNVENPAATVARQRFDGVSIDQNG